MICAMHGAAAPTRRWLLTFTALAVIFAFASSARADSGLANVTVLPRIEGAVESEARGKPDTGRLTYTAPGSMAQALDAARKVLMADGWLPYTQPYQQMSRAQYFKRGRHGLLVSLTMAGGKVDRSSVSYSATRIDTSVPVPPDATDIVLDEYRPYLSAVTPGSIENTLTFYKTGLAEHGWMPLQPGDRAARWPGAKFEDAPTGGIRVYFVHPDKRHIRPVQLTLMPKGDGKTAIEIRSAAFAMPQALDAGADMAGLPRPTQTKGVSSTGADDSPQREVKAAVIADLPVTLAFYRSELTRRGFSESATNAVVTPDEVKLAFNSAESRAQMTMVRHYDLTIVQIVVRDSDEAIAAKARAKKEASNQFMQNALSEAQSLIAASEDKRRADIAEAATKPTEKLAAQVAQGMPILVPDGASEVNHDAASGQLDFSSTASVKSLAAFYRDALKAQGWRERPSVINNPTMSVLNFTKAKADLAFTIMQMGPKATVRVSGSGLKSTTVAAKPAEITTSAAKAEPILESDDDPTFPTPKQRSLRVLGTAGWPDGAPFRHELNASVPAGIETVLAFYRSELGRLQWQEITDAAVIKPDRAKLSFETKDGPALLTLGRDKGETTVSLVQRHSDVAEKAGILPAPGKARLMFGNMGDAEITIAVAGKTVKVKAGAGTPQDRNGPTLELPPGEHKLAIKTTGRPAHETKLKVAASDSWGVMVAPDGKDILPLQLY